MPSTPIEMRKITFLLILFFWNWNLAVGQSDLKFNKLSSEQGVNQSIIYALAQDDTGNIWMATGEGVIRYNSKFSSYYNKYSGLPQNFGSRIQTVFKDSKNRIWIGGEDGIAFFDRASETFKGVESSESLNPLLVKFFAQDSDGNIWVGCYNGLWKMTPDEKNFQLQRMQNLINIQTVHLLNDQILAGTESGLFGIDPGSNQMEKLTGIGGNYNITDLDRLDENSILVGTRENGLLVVDNNFKLVQKIDLPTGIRDFPIFDLIVRDNLVYIATDGAGLIITNKRFDQFNVYQSDENEPNSLSSNGVYDIHIDDENILWIATYGGGLNYYNPQQSHFQNFEHTINEPNSLVSSFTRAIAQDELGRLWFGTRKGLSIYFPDTQVWRHFANLKGTDLSSHIEIILCLEPDGDYMWAGTYDGGAYKINIQDFNSTHFSPKTSPKIPLNKIYDIYRDSENDIWLGGIDGNLTRIKPDGSIIDYPLTQVKAIVEGENNTIYTAGRNGLQKIEKSNEQISTFEKTLPGYSDNDYFTINALESYGKNSFLLASNGGGLLLYNVNNNTSENFGIDEGMPSEVIQGVLSTSKNNIWASTTNGLVHMTFKDKDTILRVYNQDDGLASNEFNYGSFAKLKDGRIAFGGVEGVTIFEPSIPEPEGYYPTIYFEQFRVANNPILPGSKTLPKSINVVDKIELKYNQNSFGFNFIGIMHNASSNIKYSWKLDGFDESWSQPISQNTVSYTNISPGEYTFRVKAANRLGEFGPEKNIRIEVNSPWYLSIAALIIYVLLFIGLVYLLIYITAVLVNKKNAEQQVNFYNNLTHEIRTPLTILLSSLDNHSKQIKDEEGSERVKNTIKRINSLFEQMLTYQKSTIDESRQIDAININQHTAEILDDFKPLLKERNIEIEYENSWNDNLFYFNREDFDRVIFNLVSNSVKYSFDDSRIKVKTETGNDNCLRITIEDTGMGIPLDQQKNILKRFYRARNVVNSQKPGTGLGLMLVKNIVDKSGGEIYFESEENKGTAFYIKLKNKKHRYKHASVLKNSNESVIHLEETGKLDEFSDSKILLVEDNDDLRAELERVLGKYFQVYEATNGKHGLEKSAIVYPDLILTDLIMPEMDGLAMAKAIKKDINLNHIPIFMLTLLQNSSQKIESLEAGISEYLEKPVDINLLIAKIVNALSFQKSIQKRYQEQSDLETALDFRNESDENFIKEIEGFVLERVKDENFSVHDICARFNMSRTSL